MTPGDAYTTPVHMRVKALGTSLSALPNLIFRQAGCFARNQICWPNLIWDLGLFRTMHVMSNYYFIFCRHFIGKMQKNYELTIKAIGGAAQVNLIYI
jgi:hypothetical protein